MSAPAFNHILIADTVDQVIANPTAPHLWQALVTQFEDMPIQPVYDHIVRMIGQHVPAAGVAGIMRGTFLAYITRESAWIDAAAAAALDLQPFDASRLSVFANLYWGLATIKAGGHHGFREMLQRARVPELMARLGQAIDADAVPARKPGVRAALRKVVVVVPHLGNMRHPPTRMAMEQAALLMEQGIEVMLASCQDLSIAEPKAYLGCGRFAAPPETDTDWLAAHLPRGIGIRISDARLSVLRRWRGMTRIIVDWKPDLVMLVGLHTPLAWPLYARYPVLALSTHAVAPIAPVDVWLSADAMQDKVVGQPWGAAVPPAQGHFHPFRSGHRAVTDSVPRATFGLPDGPLILVTVGARLANEIRGDWAARMLALLETHPDIVWLLVGGSGALPDALAGAAPGRIYRLAFTERIADVLAVGDIYVNPPRVGGGLSVAEAMAQGVPVVAFAAGDGGAKLGTLAQPDDAAYFARLEALIAQPALRAASGREQQALFESTLDLARSAPSLLAACAQAQRRAAERLA